MHNCLEVFKNNKMKLKRDERKHIFIYIRTHTHTHIYLYIYMSTHTLIYIHTYTNIYLYIHTYTHIYLIYTYINIYESKLLLVFRILYRILRLCCLMYIWRIFNEQTLMKLRILIGNLYSFYHTYCNSKS